MAGRRRCVAREREAVGGRKRARPARSMVGGGFVAVFFFSGCLPCADGNARRNSRSESGTSKLQLAQPRLFFGGSNYRHSRSVRLQHTESRKGKNRIRLVPFSWRHTRRLGENRFPAFRRSSMPAVLQPLRPSFGRPSVPRPAPASRSPDAMSLCRANMCQGPSVARARSGPWPVTRGDPVGLAATTLPSAHWPEPSTSSVCVNGQVLAEER